LRDYANIVLSAKCLVLSVLLYSALSTQHSALFAQETKYAGEFLSIPVGARALSLGGAYTAIANDEAAFHWNPGGVSLIPHKLAGFMYSAEYGAPGSALANFYHLGFTFPMKDVTIAANWVRLSVGDMMHTPDYTDQLANKRQQLVRQYIAGSPDYFSDNEDAIVISVARNNHFTLDWGWLYYKQDIEVPIGVNFKIIHQGIGDFGSASGIGIDAGAMVRFSLAEFWQAPALGNISVGTTVTDIAGTRLNWSTERSQIVPMRVTGGVAYSQPLPLLRTVIIATSDFLIGEAERLRFGLDATYDDKIALRLGFNRGLFTTGAGFNWEKKIDVNYSLAINTDLGPEHRLSFAVDIDNIMKKPEPPEESNE
jgi:hypothetical protein